MPAKTRARIGTRTDHKKTPLEDERRSGLAGRKGQGSFRCESSGGGEGFLRTLEEDDGRLREFAVCLGHERAEHGKEEAETEYAMYAHTKNVRGKLMTRKASARRMGRLRHGLSSL